MKRYTSLIRLFAVCLVFFLLFTGCDSKRRQSPSIAKGTIDLKGWDFEADGIVNLAGQWTFHWQEFLTPADFIGDSGRKSAVYLNVPSLWSRETVNGQPLTSKGFGTYRLVADVLPDGTSKALLIRSFLSVCKVWVNGKLVASSGEIGDSEAIEEPRRTILTPHFFTTDGKIEIVIQVSNFHNVDGGLGAPIQLGTEDQILQSVRTRWGITGILTGMFLVIGLFHLILFVQDRSDNANLYYGLYCLIWAVGSFFGDTGGNLALILFPDMPWRLSIDLVLISYGLGPPLIVLFYNSLFPRYKSKLIEWFYLALGGVFIVYLLATPPNAYGPIVRLYIISTLGVYLYLLVKYLVDILKKEKGARLLIPGYLALAVSFLNDKLHDLNIVDTAPLMPLGSALFLLSYSILISVRFSDTYKEASQLSHELEVKNIELEESLKSAQENIRLKSQLEEQHQREVQATIEAEKSVLEKLRYQLNPHFLFNALTSIRGAILKDGDVAREMVAGLAEFCRLTLSAGKEEWLAIKLELKLVQHYLAIEQIRLGDYMKVTMAIDAAIEERKIPSFLLQPLVENAVKFGKLTSPDYLEIKISVQGRENRVHIEVANTGSWMDENVKDQMRSTGIGLENLRNRLEKIYSGEAGISRKSENGWVIMEIDIP